MKKIVIPVLAALLLGGCEFHDTYETYEIIKQGTDMTVGYKTAKGNEWFESGTEGQPGFYIYQEFAIPEITDDVLNNGAVLAYLVDAEGRDNILPYVFPVDNGHELIMQNIRYEVEKGILTFVIEWQDFKKYIQGDYEFKICILQPGTTKTGKK
ncbi:MAG: hypothetical protein J6T97_07930 [Bacteroidaceae bacterium]|nr:hypothetical protein [Bacteroidaceae bacterium]MBR5158415.1 hypothetical protein [Bacteroidaceae bacterium]